MFGMIGKLLLAVVAAMVLMSTFLIAYHMFLLKQNSNADVQQVWTGSKTFLISSTVMNTFSLALVGLLFAMGGSEVK